MSTLDFVSSRVDSEFADDVRRGLTRTGQKELPSKYFYDDLGSALFEAITLLPEYGLTRADARILRGHSGEIAGRAGTPLFIAELGSGSGQKTRYLLDAVRERQPDLRYCPIDVSGGALEHCERELATVCDVRPICESYLPGIGKAGEFRRADERLLLLFLGSTIGNFERTCAQEFLRELRSRLRAGDLLLMGTDLVKPVKQLITAYDDPTGVTAAFNLNLLARVNRELDADFDLRRFTHLAIYNERLRRVEMHLRSNIDQTVEISKAGCTVLFRAGETIWTESSHKYEIADLEAMARDADFEPAARWVDEEWPFAENLWIAA